MKYVRCYAGPDGESHFQDVELSTPMGELGTANVPQVGISPSLPSRELFFVAITGESHAEQRDVGWHTAPDRRFVMYLKGEAEQESSDGEVRRFVPGDVILFEDTTGRGHRSRNIGDQLLAMVPLE